jgi:hypothetical protein
MRFRFLTGDANYTRWGGSFISGKQNNGEFDFWVVLQIRNEYEDAGADESPAGYSVSLSIVSPSQAGEDKVKAAMECCGITETMMATAVANGFGDEAKVEALHTYGIATPVWSENGNNHRRLMQAARQFANTELDSLFGFVMDRPVNRIGSTGWEALRGDLDAALKGPPRPGVNPTAHQILRKMSRWS